MVRFSGVLRALQKVKMWYFVGLANNQKCDSLIGSTTISAVLSWQICSGCPVLSVIFCLSCPACPVLDGFLLSHSFYRILAVTFWLFHSGYPFLGCPVLAFTAVFFWRSCWQYRPVRPVSAILPWLHCSGCPVVRFCCPYPGLPVPFCLFRSACHV
jgi:hypothetical protein